MGVVHLFSRGFGSRLARKKLVFRHVTIAQNQLLSSKSLLQPLHVYGISIRGKSTTMLLTRLFALCRLVSGDFDETAADFRIDRSLHAVHRGVDLLRWTIGTLLSADAILAGRVLK
jgi:hypothetical protein